MPAYSCIFIYSSCLSSWASCLGTKINEIKEEEEEGAIALAYNPEHDAQSKHIDIQYPFVRDCVENGKIKL